jgi:hypothetical protein
MGNNEFAKQAGLNNLTSEQDATVEILQPSSSDGLRMTRSRETGGARIIVGWAVSNLPHGLAL